MEVLVDPERSEGSRRIMPGYTYIMTNQRHTVLYTGSTNEILRRISQHRRRKRGSFTKRYNVDKVVYLKEYATLQEAREAEKRIKGWTRKKKIDLINSVNPEWKDLIDE